MIIPLKHNNKISMKKSKKKKKKKKPYQVSHSQETGTSATTFSLSPHSPSRKHISTLFLAFLVFLVVLAVANFKKKKKKNVPLTKTKKKQTYIFIQKILHISSVLYRFSPPYIQCFFENRKSGRHPMFYFIMAKKKEP